MAGLGRKVWAADEVLAAEDLQNYIQDQTVMRYVNASARTSGILAPTEGMVTYLDSTNSLEVFDGSAWVAVVADGSITANKIANGAVNSDKLATGAVITDKIANSAVDANKIANGNVTNVKLASDIDAGKLASGTVNIDRIPTIPSSRLGTGNWNMGVATLTTVNVTASGVVSAGDFSSGGTLTANGGIVSTDVYNRNLSGPFKAVWVDSSGRIGNTASTIRVKQDVVDSDLTADSARQLRLREFRYIADVEKDADAPSYVGLIAEELLEIPGMEKFVYYDELEDGSRLPAGIHYEWLALSLIPLVQSLADRMDSVESRLNDLEGK
jgi:hypothetical protein